MLGRCSSISNFVISLSKNENVIQLIIGSESNLGWKGVPILFDSNYFEQIKSLTGDKGARSVLQKNIHCAKFLEAGDNLIDIDTPECYEKFYKKFSPQ